jgi:O-antigen/teichoic acid export membrane protein
MTHLLIMLVRGLTLLSRFLLSILLARMLTPADLGYFGLVSASLSFGIVLTGAEFHNFLVREIVVATPHQQVAYFRNQIVVYLGTYFAILTITALTIAVRPNLAVPAMWFFALLVVEHLTLEAARNLVALSWPIRANIVLFLRGGLWVYAIGGIMVLQPAARNVNAVFTVWIIGGAIALAISAIFFRTLPWRQVSWQAINRHWIWNGMKTSVPFMLIVACALTANYADRFFINAYLISEELGIYTFFSMLTIGIQSLVTTISQQYLPKVVMTYKSGGAAYRITLVRFLRTIALSIVIIDAVATLAIYPLLWFLSRPEYTAKIHIFFLLLLAASLRALADVPAHGLYSMRADRSLFVSNLASALLATGISFAFIPSMGLLGAAIASVAAAGTLLFAQSLFFLLRHGGIIRKLY